MSGFTSQPNVSFDLLRGLDEPTLRIVAQVVKPISAPAGHVLFRRGVRPDAAYMITGGMLSVSAFGNQQDTHFLATLAAGESVGGWEMLTGDALSLDIVVVQDATLLRLDHAGFEAVLASSAAAYECIAAAATAQMHRWRLLIALHVSHVFGNLEETALR